MKRLFFVAPVVAFAALIAVFAHGLTQDPSRIPSVMINRPLPPFRLAGLDGGAGFANSDFGAPGKAGEPHLLNVFAAWCATCPQEHPMLFKIASTGTQVYGIDWMEQPDAGSKWLARLGNPYAHVGSDPSARTGIDLGVTGVPETFVVDGHGRVRYKQIGPITAADWHDTLQPMLARLRSEA
jgi:cytochrome c biogenesis protein CcmG/thiol:disulfide interchange protein DsbE